MDGRPATPALSAAQRRQRANLEHGRRYATGIPLADAENSLGLLQAAFRTGDQSTDRSTARDACHVSSELHWAGLDFGVSDPRPGTALISEGAVCRHSGH